MEGRSAGVSGAHINADKVGSEEAVRNPRTEAPVER